MDIREILMLLNCIILGADADVRRQDSGRSGGTMFNLATALADTQKKIIY